MRPLPLINLVIFNFRTGYFVPIIDTDNAISTKSEGDDEEDILAGETYTDLVEYDKWRVFQNYLYSWFPIDFVSGIPFAALELILSSGSEGGDTGSLSSIKALKLLRFLKLGRLLKVEKILSNLDRDTLDDIEDFFANGTTKTFFLLFKLVLIMSYANHIMACGFVVVGKAGDKAGVDNWLRNEENTGGRGPFESNDTTGENGDDRVYHIYIAAFYFCLTTMTSGM